MGKLPRDMFDRLKRTRKSFAALVNVILSLLVETAQGFRVVLLGIVNMMWLRCIRRNVIDIQCVKLGRMIPEFSSNRRGYSPIDGRIRGVVSRTVVAVVADLRSVLNARLHQAENSLVVLDV